MTPTEAVKMLREALARVLMSAHPNPDEHPSMTRAWKLGDAALAATAEPAKVADPLDYHVPLTEHERTAVPATPTCAHGLTAAHCFVQGCGTHDAPTYSADDLRKVAEAVTDAVAPLVSEQNVYAFLHLDLDAIIAKAVGR